MSSFISLLSLTTVGPISPIVPFISFVTIIILVFSLIEFYLGTVLSGKAFEIDNRVLIEGLDLEILLLIGNFFEFEAITYVDIKLYVLFVGCFVMDDYRVKGLTELAGCSFNGSGQVGDETFSVGEG